MTGRRHLAAWAAAAISCFAALTPVAAWAENPAPQGLAQSVPDGEIYDAAGKRVAPGDLVAALATADVVVLGEVHDNPTHHDWQAWIAQGLQSRRGIGAFAFEMIEESREADLAAHRAAGGSTGSLGAFLDWEARGWPDWSFYQGVIDAAPDAPLFGGALARSDLRRFARDLSAWPQADLYALADPLPADEQATREAEKIAAHCDKLPAEMAPMMVAAQRLWDASFAAAALRAHMAADENLAVLVVGSQHARKDRGAPAALARAAPGVKTMAVGMTETALGDAVDPEAAAVFDYLIAARAPERGDPCAAFE